MESPRYDAVLIVSFGGPEGPDDVLPFLENVLRGRNVPEARKQEVARNYAEFGGVSPLNGQNRELRRLLAEELVRSGIPLPVFWGNRNWSPYLRDALVEMRTAGVRRALAYVTSAYSSYSGCRQYLEDIERARAEVGADAPHVDKLREFHNHPLFVAFWTKSIRACLEKIPLPDRKLAQVVFTAHSLPLAMSSTCDYLAQVNDTASLIAEALSGVSYSLAFQSRSGPSTQPWLEPALLQHLEILAAQKTRDLVIAPIGFVSDHMEIVYDLDRQAAEKARSLDLRMQRAATPGTDPTFLSLLVELIRERLDPSAPRESLGKRGVGPDLCPPGCCIENKLAGLGGDGEREKDGS